MGGVHSISHDKVATHKLRRWLCVEQGKRRLRQPSFFR